MMITFESGRARIGPALKKKDPEMESSYYYAPGDRRDNKRLMTVMRDNEGLRADVELFRQLIDMGASSLKCSNFSKTIRSSSPKQGWECKYRI